jgi:predicted transcriptional regulator
VGADVVAILDAPAKALATRLHVRPEIRFAAIPASIDAAERGLDVALILPEDRVAGAVVAIEGANERLAGKITYETVPLA